ncbi:unnamed protein product, partial [marine sediment metagenome]
MIKRITSLLFVIFTIFCLFIWFSQEDTIEQLATHLAIDTHTDEDSYQLGFQT